jgi:hypothetical protein
MRTPLHRSQMGHVPGARLAEQAGIARISNASNLGKRFRDSTRLAALDWIMSEFGFAFSASIVVSPTPPPRASPARLATAPGRPTSARRWPSQAFPDKAMARSGPRRGAAASSSKRSAPRRP